MRRILFKYLTKFTSLNEEEQQAIVDNILVEEYKKEQFSLDKEMFQLNAISC